MESFVAKFPDFLKPWGEEMLLHYVDFGGTLERRKFWLVVLTDVIIGAIAMLLALIPMIGWIFSTVFGVGMLVPRIAIDVRRLRDTGKSWGYMFLLLVPLVGPIILIVLLCQK